MTDKSHVNIEIENNSENEEQNKDQKDKNETTEIKEENTNNISKNQPQKEHFCYIVYDSFGSTYNGYTCNMNRRIRQHNNQIKGGAKFTTRKQMKTNLTDHWKYMLAITSNDVRFDYKKALSLEWSIKNPTNKRTRPNRSPLGRINSLPLVFSNKKFCDIKFQLFIHEKNFASSIYKELSKIENLEIIDTI